MAKISARGATKVAEIRARRKDGTYEVVLVMCSDGRILRRYVGDTTGGGYGLLTKVKRRENINRAALVKYAEAIGYVEI